MTIGINYVTNLCPEYLKTQTNELGLEEGVEFVLLLIIIYNGEHQHSEQALFMIPIPSLPDR